MPKPADDREREAREALERVERDQQSLLGSSMARASDHFAAKDAPEGDAIELWGRRIGRTLSLIGVIVLSYWLGQQLGFW
jgi:hypothetical protein